MANNGIQFLCCLAVAPASTFEVSRIGSVQLDHVDDGRQSGFCVVSLDMGQQQQSVRVALSELHYSVFCGQEFENVLKHDGGVMAGQVVVEVQRCYPARNLSHSLRLDMVSQGIAGQICGHIQTGCNVLGFQFQASVVVFSCSLKYRSRVLHAVVSDFENQFHTFVEALSVFQFPKDSLFVANAFAYRLSRC